MNDQRKQVSIIIVSYNVQHFLELCLDAVMRAIETIDAEVIVVDNCSSDDSCRMVREQFPGVLLLANSQNAGFAKANNQGIALAKGTYLHFLNPDTVLAEDFYTQTLAFLDRNPKVGCLGPRLIDGHGRYSLDSKKAFPSFWVSVFKVMGLSRLFPGSPFFNKYYAAHIREYQVAEVDILSGCCLLVRDSALKDAGGGFDEAYFMYCEDVDLCYRIQNAGYQNYYFPETTVVHYKGESTRKLSYHYMKVFYKAHALFVKKYYPRQLGTIYITSLRIVLSIRNFMNWGRHLFSLFKMFLLDALLLTIVTLLIKDVWFDTVAQVSSLNPNVLWVTLPVFVTIWLLSLYLNGAYDKPFSLFKAGRGMIVGTIIVLAGYGLLPLEYRYSRAVVLFSGLAGTMLLLLARWLLSLLKWIRLVPRGKVDYTAAVVSDDRGYTPILTLLSRSDYNLEVLGRVAIHPSDKDKVLGALPDLPDIRSIYHINELIFDAGALSYRSILYNMERCAPKPSYKIKASKGAVVIGSNEDKQNAELFLLNNRYQLGSSHNRRNKRIVDILTALLFLLFYPFIMWRVKNAQGFWEHIFQVLGGKKTWIGYTAAITSQFQLPAIKTPVAAPYPLKEDYSPDFYNQGKLAQLYATSYSTLDDLRLIWYNFRFLGEKK